VAKISWGAGFERVDMLATPNSGWSAQRVGLRRSLELLWKTWVLAGDGLGAVLGLSPTEIDSASWIPIEIGDFLSLRAADRSSRLTY